jgi:NADPH-dependent 7-cyano-7-deazaguanine reductase QueF
MKGFVNLSSFRLFIIFINDIVTEIHSSIKLFADDTSLYVIVDNLRESAITLNNDMATII